MQWIQKINHIYNFKKTSIMKKSVKTNNVLTNDVFNAVFKSIKAEGATLNATLRNIAQLATINKEVKVIANWLNVSSSNVSGKNLTELRSNILAQLVFYTSEGESVQPANLYKVATIDGVNYYEARSISWLQALKMICNRKNKALAAKHIELTSDSVYNVNAEVISDESVLVAVATAKAVAEEERAEIASVKKLAVESYKASKAI